VVERPVVHCFSGFLTQEIYVMQNLTRAHDELFARGEDERFPTLQALWDHCSKQRDESADRWHPPSEIAPVGDTGGVSLRLAGSDGLALNDWSFSQLCKLASVSKDTLNRVSAPTAAQVFRETLFRGTLDKPLQVYTQGTTVRSIHGASYTRLHNTDLLGLVREFATDFQPPHEASGGGSGLYCGEQDMFCFFIDPTGWTEIEGEAFAPGFFIWNSEVGRRSVGIETFWFQAVCQNHIVWDAVEVVTFSRKHTANVHESLREIRNILLRLVEKRDARRDGFVNVMKKAMTQSLGHDADEVLKVLTRQGITQALAKQALEVAKAQGRFTVFCLVDALTRIAGNYSHAGDRTEVDQKASSLLSLVG